MGTQPTISAEALQACFSAHLSKVSTPDLDTCERWAGVFNGCASSFYGPLPTGARTAAKHARLTVKHLPAVTAIGVDTKAVDSALRTCLSALQHAQDWQAVACGVAASTMQIVEDAGGAFPRTIGADHPLCHFVRAVLLILTGTRYTLSAVSDALRHRRGRNSKSKGRIIPKMP